MQSQANKTFFQEKKLKLPFIISLPHCSALIPEKIQQSIMLSDAQILESVDIGTKEIFDSLPVEIIISADYNRLTVDLNRNYIKSDSRGVIALVDYHGRNIFYPESIPDKTETKNRIEKYYKPFHRRLTRAVNVNSIKALFDCHSLNEIGPAGAPDAGKKRKDIILSNCGDKNGNKISDRPISCPTNKLNLIKSVFLDQGFSVSLNEPYTGGYITSYYGQKLLEKGKFAVQIEINQALYVDAHGIVPSPHKLNTVKIQMRHALEKIAKI